MKTKGELLNQIEDSFSKLKLLVDGKENDIQVILGMAAVPMIISSSVLIDIRDVLVEMKDIFKLMKKGEEE